MRLELNTLPQGSSQLIFDSLAPLQADPGIDWEPLELRAEIHVDNQGTTLIIQGMVSCRGRFQCDRGLEWFEDTFEGRFDLIASFDHTRFEGADTEEVLLLNVGDNELDLGPYIRDTILLAIPISHVCGPECPTGNDLQKSLEPEPEIDERWAKLKDLFKEEE